MSQLELAGTGPRIFSVSELSGGLRELLEEEVGRVFVAGEIQDLFRARSGHSYFTLADDRAKLRAVLFRGAAARLPFDPEEGLEVVVEAGVSIYAERGDLQLIVRSLEPRGRGALQLAFEQLRARLSEEGLFDEARKRPFPELPRRVGVVTSPSGAAIRDIIQVSGRRFPGIPLLIAPTRVQGEGAEREVAAALAALADFDDVDVIVLARGGGSLEDLMAFNTEVVARAIRATRVPVVAGVGHETDVTIADLAADLRAPTPSAAVAAVMPDGDALREHLERELKSLVRAVLATRDEAGGRLALLRSALRAQAPEARLREQARRIAASRRVLAASLRGRIAPERARLSAASARLLRVSEALVSPGRGRLEAAAARLDRASRELAPGARSRLGS
ncbi:MAG: exodeoxyribonuclease VII large subunit, partial [Myxococcota bacterium]|nr:exodeoxyribonuclease VII large subunit [Myxococcota bacterium]